MWRLPGGWSELEHECEMALPLISVVIPTYNRAHHLHCAVESVLAQVGVDVEVIIVDDGSTDGTHALVARQASQWGSRMRSIRQEHAERSVARNVGLREARGNFVAFLDSDDLWRPHHLRACVRALQRCPEAVAAFGECGQIDANGRVIRALVRRPIRRQALPRNLCLKRLILHPTDVVVRRQILGLSPFDPQIPGAEDWLLWVQLACRGPFEPVNEPTVWMRVHTSGVTFGNPQQFTRSLMQAAERVIATRLPQQMGIPAERIRAINRTHCAYAWYLNGDWSQAQQWLSLALRDYPAVIREPDFWQVAAKLLVGPSLSRRIRALRQRGRGTVIAAAQPLQESCT